MIARTLTMIAAVLALSACVTAPANVDITPTSDRGLIVVEAEPAPSFHISVGAGGPIEAGYFLTLARYPQGASVTSPPVLDSRWVHLRARPSGARAFHAIDAAPGTYVLEALNAGLSWGSCFNSATISFDLRPGEVLYLGSFSPAETLADISTNLPSSVPAGSVRYVYNRSAPTFTQSDVREQKVSEIQAFLSATYPGVHAPVRFADLQPAAFQSDTPSPFARFPRCAETE